MAPLKSLLLFPIFVVKGCEGGHFPLSVEGFVEDPAVVFLGVVMVGVTRIVDSGVLPSCRHPSQQIL